MARLNRVTALLVGLALLPRSASAVTISFAEPVAETDPVKVTTTLVVTSMTVTHDSAVVTGFHGPFNSPSPVTSGSRSAGLFEPGSTTRLRAYVLLSAGNVTERPPFGILQDISISFFTRSILVSELPSGFPFGGGVTANGEFQDLSPFLGTLPEGLIVTARSFPTPAEFQ